MEWISVKDRLPEKHVIVLVFNDTKDIFVATMDIIHPVYQNEPKLYWSFEPSGWGSCCSKDITHWMPLPEPPQENMD